MQEAYCYRLYRQCVLVSVRSIGDGTMDGSLRLVPLSMARVLIDGYGNGYGYGYGYGYAGGGGGGRRHRTE